jgi:hypothetical protein
MMEIIIPKSVRASSKRLDPNKFVCFYTVDIHPDDSIFITGGSGFRFYVEYVNILISFANLGYTCCFIAN